LALSNGASATKLALYLTDISRLDLSGDAVLSITGNGNNIYYIYYDPTVDTALNDQNFQLQNGGCLIAIGSSNTTCTPTQTSPVPEPGTLSVFGMGLLGMLVARFRRRS
jgi:PEP-CTERM motif